MVGAILTYINNGSRRAGGQIVGADGRGIFGVIFEAETVEIAEAAAVEYARILERAQEYKGHITEIHVVPAVEYFTGPALQIREVVTPAGETTQSSG